MAEGDFILDDAKQGMEKSLDSLLRDMGRIRTGRANPQLLDGVMVDYYGTPTPLKSLAALNVPEPRLITVSPFDPGSLVAVERAILKSDLGLTPVNDGKLLRVPIPELTEERRREMCKVARKCGEEHKLGVRGSRREALDLVKELENGGELAEDDARRLQKKVQDLTDAYIEKIEQAVSAKEQDILRV